MSTAANKDELDWSAIRQRITHLFPKENEANLADLALYVHLTGTANAMDLSYAGYERMWASTQLTQWRSQWFLNGNLLTEKSLLSRYSELKELLAQIAAGEFKRGAVIRPVLLPTPAPDPMPPAPPPPVESEPVMQVETPVTQCAKDDQCKRPNGHRGVHSPRRQAVEMPAVAAAITALAPQPVAEAAVRVPTELLSKPVEAIAQPGERKLGDLSVSFKSRDNSLRFTLDAVVSVSVEQAQKLLGDVQYEAEGSES